MFGSIKKAMVTGAVVATAALAGPAMASASPFWTGISGPTSVTLSGQISLNAAVTTECAVSGTADIENSATMAEGTIRSFVIDYTSCTIAQLPGCTVANATTTAPWSATGVAGPRLAIAGVSFTNYYASSPFCGPLSGQTVTASTSGAISPSWDAVNAEFVFDASAGTLSTPFGPATLSGYATIDSPAGIGLL